MEQPLIMFPVKNRINSAARLSAASLAAFLAGCSLNPFTADDESPAPVEQGATAPDRSTSMDPAARAPSPRGSAAAATNEQALTPIPLAANHPDEYVVKEGDTLWDIAATFLKDPWYWPEVWYVNPQVRNPHLIYPGDVLALVTIDGQQRITTVRGSAYRLSPHARVTPLDEAITSIPYEQIAAFLSKGLVLERSQIRELPYVLSTRGDHLIAAAGNDVYVRGGDPAPTGTRYSLVHVGDELRDPDDNRVIGYQGVFVGEGTLSRGGDPATISLTESTRETLSGDRLVPETVDIPLNFFPKTPDIDVDGRIIHVVDGVALIGQYQVVVINRGARDGLAPGDVLTVYQAGDVIRDRYAGGSSVTGSGFMNSFGGGEKVQLPDEKAGNVMVFKVYDRIGYGLVMEATSDIHVLDAVRTPE